MEVRFLYCDSKGRPVYLDVTNKKTIILPSKEVEKALNSGKMKFSTLNVSEFNGKTYAFVAKATQKWEL